MSVCKGSNERFKVLRMSKTVNDMYVCFVKTIFSEMSWCRL